MRLFLSVLAIFLAIQSCFALDNQKSINGKVQIDLESADEIGSKYTFDDNVMSGKVVKIKKGTTLPILLQTSLDTSAAQENDEVVAALNEDLKIDGAVVAKQNSILYGKVVKAKHASNFMRGGKVKIKFDKLITTDNKIYTISTKTVDFVVSAEDKLKVITETVMEIVIIAAYAVLTGGAGAVVVALFMMVTPTGLLPIFTKHGNDAIIPAATPMAVSLSSPVNAVATY